MIEIRSSMSFWARWRLRGLLWFLVSPSFISYFVVAPVAFAQAQSSILSMIANLESGGNTTATNPNSSSTGEYQDTQAALAESGILQINSPPTASDFGSGGNWNNVTFLPNQYGITSRQDLLNASPQVQTAIETSYLNATWSQDQNQGLTSYEGQTVNGQQINQSAIIGCSELLGTSGCQSYLATGQASSPALTATAQSVISQYSQADSSAITGSPTTQVAQSQPSVSPGGENSAGYAMYCNSAASSAINQVAQQNIQNAINLAANPATGYSLVNGSGILSPISGGYSQFSCLNNLFNQGLGVLFEPPSLSSILNQLVNAACSEAENAIAGVLQPLNENFYKAANVDGFSAGGGASIGLNNSGTVSTSVNGIGTGLSPDALTSQIAGQSIGTDIANPVIFGNEY